MLAGINHWRWLFTFILLAVFLLAFPDFDALTLAVALALAYYSAGFVTRWFKKTFLRPVVLFDLHGVLLEGDWLVENIRERSGTRRLIRGVRRHHFTGAFTNLSPELGDFYNRKFGLFGEFDAVYSSGRYGVRKPDERFYKLVLQEIGVPAHDIVFVDDLEENLAVARKLGMRTVLFKGPDKAAQALSELGVRH